MNLRRLLPLLSVCCACATGSAAEKKAVTKPLGSFPSASVTVVAIDPSATNAAQRVSTCQRSMEEKINASGVFAQLIPEGEPAGAALRIKAVLTDETQRLLGMEKHQNLMMAVEFTDGADQSSVGAVEVRGNSDDGTRSTVGGIDTAAFEDLLKKACDQAADQLAAYLKAKK